MIKGNEEIQEYINKLGSIHKKINMALKELETLELAVLEEKRKHKRIHMVASVELLIKGEPPIEAYSVNISRGGICLHTNRVLPVDNKVWVRLCYLMDYKDRAFERIDGKVRWCTPVGQIYGVGIQFENVDPTSHPILFSLLQPSDEI